MDANPGPGAYEIRTTISKDGPKFSFRGRGTLKPRIVESPPPGAYNPMYTLIDKSNYSGISFGIGKRIPDDKPRPSTPGPGTYGIPSTFIKSVETTTTRFYSPIKARKNNKR